MMTLSTFVLGLLFAFPAAAAGCDPAGTDACVDWAQKEISATGCRMDTQTFANAVTDLYLNKGCRLNGTTWTDVSTGATVKGSVSGGINTDTAGCIARYTPSSYLATGGFFRTPKESMNGSLRNKTISGCAMSDPGAITAPIIAKIESCECAAGSAKPAPITASEPPAGPMAEPEASPPPAGECPQGQAVDPDTEQCRDIIACPADKHFTRKGPFECGCAQLYILSPEDRECLFSMGASLSLDSETHEAFLAAIEGLGDTKALGLNEGTVIDGSLARGEKIKIGVLKQPDGKFMFTADGFHYYEDPADAIKPWPRWRTLWLWSTEGWDNFWKAAGKVVGIGKYAGKNTAGEEGKEAQEDGQIRLEASSSVSGDLGKELKDPEERAELANGIQEKWVNRIKNSTTEKYDDQLLEEIKNLTGIDVPGIKEKMEFVSDLLEFKQIAELSGDALEEATKIRDAVLKLSTVPADSVVILAKELRSKSFEDAVHVYIQERQRNPGKDGPAKIRELLADGQLPELDFVTSIKGVSQFYAKDMVLEAYEEAYQRYMISKQLKGK